MKKLLALLLCAVMVLSLFAGCNTTPGGNDDSTDKGGSDINQELPEDLTLTIGLPMSSLVEDYDTNAFTLWLEEETGYNIEFQKFQPMPNDYKSQLNVAMIDGEPLPDILIGFDLGRGVYQEYGEDGILLDLAPYFEDEKISGDWWELFNSIENEEFKEYVKQMMYSDDGETMYAFPSIQISAVDVITTQAFINQEWLDKLNLPMPTDTESLYNTLVAFKTQDPNGNGLPDEIPLMGKGYDADAVSWLMNMFLFVDDSRMWRVADDGTFSHIYDTEEYREALIFINKLVKENLLPTANWSASDSKVKSLLNPADNVATLGIYLGHPSVVGMKSDVYQQYEAIPFWGYSVESMQNNTYRTFITTDCEYPLAAFNVLKLIASEEGSMRMRYGEKGVDWVEADEGTKSFLGVDATFKVINENVWSNIGNSSWNSANCFMLFAPENETAQLDENAEDWIKYKMRIMGDTYNNHVEAMKRYPDNIPNFIVYSIEDEEAIANERTNVKKVITSAREGFCRGNGEKYNDPNNDTQWAAYVAEIEANGMAKWMQMAQEVYADTQK